LGLAFASPSPRPHISKEQLTATARNAHTLDSHSRHQILPHNEHCGTRVAGLLGRTRGSGEETEAVGLCTPLEIYLQRISLQVLRGFIKGPGARHVRHF